ncbi:MAG: futalosine hydrolase [Nitrospiraceae bacterium]|nr:futalosine hydrolase [Nitrospiraceae bacterium]
MSKILIGLISATEAESKIIIKRLGKTRFRNFYAGKIRSARVIHAVSGIGKTNASHTTALLIERFSPDMIINFGIGGAFPYSGLSIGDIAVASKEIYGDEGILMKTGFETADSIGIPFVKKNSKAFYNEFPLDKEMVKNALKSLKKLLLPEKTKTGAFLTMSSITGTLKRAKELEKRFNVICENMEGAAIAQVCVIYGIPMLEIRGISNIAGDIDKNRWNIKRASENCQKILIG